MKTIVTTALIAAATLSLTACDSSSTTTENLTVTNEAVIDDSGTDNFTAAEGLNASEPALGNAADLTDNAADATGNATNAAE